MRILAPRKRDSVTGEEVDLLTVTNVLVVPSTRQSGSTSTSNNNNNNVGRRTSSGQSQVDVLHEKLLNSSVDCDGQHVYSPYTTALIHGKQKKKDKKSQSKKKTETNNWRHRIGDSATNLWFAFNAYYCCAVPEETQDFVCSRNSLEYEQGKHVPGKVVGGIDKQKDENVSSDKEETKGIVSITSEGSLKRINDFPSFVITSESTGTTHEGNTTKPVSNVNLVAASGTTAKFKIMRTGIYHEKQVKSLCALHALNNLLQNGNAFKQEDLDKICSELDPNSWVNPHKSVFGLGNYDINVIMTALQQKKLEAVWFDKRKDPSEELNFENIYGFILNIPSDCRLGWLALPIKRKHWVAIRNLPSQTERDAGRSNYYNLDSKFDKPESIGPVDHLIDYLRGELRSAEKELFLVVTEDIGKLETWRKNPPPPPTSSIAVPTTSSGTSSHLLPVPSASGGENGADAAAGSGNNRRTSNDSGVVDLLPDLRDINVVDLNKEDLMRRQSSGVWSDLT